MGAAGYSNIKSKQMLHTDRGHDSAQWVIEQQWLENGLREEASPVAFLKPLQGINRSSEAHRNNLGSGHSIVSTPDPRTLWTLTAPFPPPHLSTWCFSAPHYLHLGKPWLRTHLGTLSLMSEPELKHSSSPAPLIQLLLNSQFMIPCTEHFWSFPRSAQA